MKRTKIAITVVLALLLAALLCYFLFLRKPLNVVEQPDAVAPPPATPVCIYGIPIDSFDITSGVIRQNQVLSEVLVSLGATSANRDSVSTMLRSTFDARTVRAGFPYKAFHSLDSTRKLCYFVYEQSPTSYVVFDFKNDFKVSRGSKELSLRQRQDSATISTSVWNAAADNGINRMLALDLSDIYAWSIDFFGLKKGDSFRVIYDERYVDDSVMVGLGRIHAAKFNHAGKTFYAFYFEQDSVGSYWDEQGNSLKKAFLKAPLKFSRISSHFSYARNHPVLRIVRPHTGVDYAAPSGTPVMSIGDGTVIEKSYNGGGGNTIKIRHNSVYTTAYLHLSRYADGIAEGSRVSQGQLIGYVGSTGLSTGPHLDFRVWKNGSPVNPLTIESPPVEPVREENRPAFDSIVQKWVSRLSS